MALFKKKPKTDNLEEFRDITDDVVEADFVPFACHWDASTVVTKNGEVLQTIQITGAVDAAAAGLDLRVVLREAIMRCVPTPDYGIWIHTIRRKGDFQVEGEFKRDFAGYLDRFWKDRNDWEHQFTNEVYVTLAREGQNADLANPKGFLRGIIPSIDIRNRENYLDGLRDQMNAVTDAMMAILGPFGPRRLGIVKKNDVYYSETCSFLGKLITLLDMEFPVKDQDLSDYLTDCDVTFGFNAMEVRMRQDGKRRFGAMLTMKSYHDLPVDMLDGLLQIPAEFIVTQVFDFVNTRLAIREFRYQKEIFTIGGAQHLAEKTGLDTMLASNKGRPVDYGLHQLTLFMLGDTVKMLETAVGKAVHALMMLGMAPMREDIKFEECYWSQLPGNFEFIRRLRPISTSKIGGFAHLSKAPVGAKDGHHWGPAVTTLYTVERAPYYFTFHVGDVGHTLMAGPPDAEKNVILHFLLAETRKFGGRLCLLDTARDSEIFIRSLSGGYYNPDPTATVKPYAKLAINPFHLPDTPENRLFLRDWMKGLIVEESAAFDAVYDEAIASVLALPQAERSLSACVALLTRQHAGFQTLFADWVAGGAYGEWFNAPADSYPAEDLISGFDLEGALAAGMPLAPLTFYLLHRFLQSLDGTPAICVVHEAWLSFGHTFYYPRMAQWLDAIAARNAIAIIVSEHLETVLGNPLNRIFAPRIVTQILLPNEQADAAYGESFGLDETDISFLPAMNTGDRHFMVRQKGRATVIAELNLTGMRDILAVLSATPEALAALERVIDAHGMQPSQWMPKFLESI